MTSQSPRIYIYKITFEEVPYYYYGVHKEKVFDEEYWGSPKRNKWCWELYTPNKQILEIFDYNDEAWLEANEVEKRLIKPVYNTDRWCLNENCGGVISLKIMRETSKMNCENGVGIFSISKEDRQQIASKVGLENYKLSRGIFSLTTKQLQQIGKNQVENKTGFYAWTNEERSNFAKRNYENGKGLARLTKQELIENAKRNYKNGIGLASISVEERQEIARRNYENKVGIHGMSEEQRRELASKNGKKTYELGVGIHGLSKEHRSAISKDAGLIGGKVCRDMGLGIHGFTPEQRKELGRKTSSQKWRCLETGYISTPAGLSNYQKARGIDKSLRERLE
jgi:hypothetical protein